MEGKFIARFRVVDPDPRVVVGSVSESIYGNRSDPDLYLAIVKNKYQKILQKK